MALAAGTLKDSQMSEPKYDSSDAKGDLIKQLVAMDDEGLLQKLGFDDQVDSFKQQMARADKLTGEARDKVLRSLTSMFTPQSYAISDIGYTIDRAEKPDKGPAGLVASCCGDCD